jgi:hypothetical protein
MARPGSIRRSSPEFVTLEMMRVKFDLTLFARRGALKTFWENANSGIDQFVS